MPIQLVPGNDYRFDRLRERAKTATRVETVRGGAPWMGYVPDLPAEMVGLNGAQITENLVASNDERQQGECLTQPPGWTVIDPGRYTSGTASDELPAMDANTTRSVVGIFWFPRTTSAGVRSGNQDLTLMMVTSGDGTNPGSAQVWRLNPGSTQWQEIAISPRVAPPSATTALAMSGAYPQSITDAEPHTQLCDWVAAPFGATPRTNLFGAITEPMLLWTNGKDPVYAYPGDATVPGDETYEELTEAFGTGTAGFRCRSIELYNDRINFFNTIEGGNHYRQRLRRSAIGNCDPDPVNDGTGFIDLEKFSGDGLRVERLGNLLACYLTDGMAVLRTTGSYLQPYAQEVITTERGLLSTHALCNIGSGRHFGIFTDGWFIVDNSGQFREVGIGDIGGGVTGTKWKYSFYDRLNRELVDRIQMHYDTTYQRVYITAPLDGVVSDTANKETWIYDIPSDRVWPQQFASTYFSSGQVLLQAAAAYSDWTDSYEDTEGTYGSYAARYGINALMHGTSYSTVMAHDPEILERSSDRVVSGEETPTIPHFRYKSVLSPVGNAREAKTLREVWLEHIQSTAPSATLIAYAMENGASIGRSISLDKGVEGNRIMQSVALSRTGSQLSVEVAGGGGRIKVVGIEADVVLRDAKRLQGAT